MTVPNSSLTAIRNKVRRITGRPSAAQITDPQIDEYINTFYVQDLPAHLRIQNMRVNYQFLTQANVPVYDLPRSIYLNEMPPVFIAGYQCYMTQSREAFFRINPEIQFLEAQAATGSAAIGAGPYVFTLMNTPILQGFKRNPPGAFYTPTVATDSIPVSEINWNVIVSGLVGGVTTTLVDDGLGNLWLPTDVLTLASIPRGSINYLTGAVSVTFPGAVDVGSAISAQYVRYNASRPTSCVFYQDQVQLYPIPDRAYTVSFEAYIYPTALINTTDEPRLREMWQLLAYGAADKIFADNADMENMQKYRPLLEEQMRLVERRTIVQQASDRTASIYSEQVGAIGQFPGNNFNF